MPLWVCCKYSKVSELFDKAAQDLFKKLQSHDHCLISILPEEKSLGLALRRYGFAANIQTVSELLIKLHRTPLRNYSPTTTA